MGSEHRHPDDVTTAATRPLTGDAAIRAAHNTLPVPDFQSTAVVEPPPLSEAVVAIVTTGGLHLNQSLGAPIAARRFAHEPTARRRGIHEESPFEAQAL
jgi:hypothetical protein